MIQWVSKQQESMAGPGPPSLVLVHSYPYIVPLYPYQTRYVGMDAVGKVGRHLVPTQ